MNATKRLAIYDKLAQHIPEPTTELIYHSHFELLVAVLLSAQSTDKQVNIVTKPLFRQANTPCAMAQMGEDGIRNAIKTLGLFNAKARHLADTCRILCEQYGEVVPDSRKALEALPGVGRKTANVILNTAFGQPTMAVDTHIFRVSNRTKLAPGDTPLAVEKKLLKVTPKQHLMDAHHLLILHGRYTCVARKPKCGSCVIYDECEFKDKPA